MEVACLVCLKLHAHLDRESSGYATNVLVLAVEARVAWSSEHDTSHILGDVTDSHSNFVVLVWLDIYNSDQGKLVGGSRFI